MGVGVGIAIVIFRGNENVENVDCEYWKPFPAHLCYRLLMLLIVTFDWCSFRYCTSHLGRNIERIVKEAYVVASLAVRLFCILLSYLCDIKQQKVIFQLDKHILISLIIIIILQLETCSWCMVWDGHWAYTRNWQTHHHSHSRLERNILIPASFHSSPTGECGLLPEHHDHWVRRRCNQITLLTSIFPPTGFVLVGIK